MNKKQIIKKMQKLNACKAGMFEFIKSGLADEDIEKIKEIKIHSYKYHELCWLINQFKLTIKVSFFEEYDTFTYDKGNKTRLEYEHGAVCKWVYDKNDNLIRNQYSSKTLNYWSNYTYDKNNNLINEEHSDGNTSKFTYDKKK